MKAMQEAEAATLSAARAMKEAEKAKKAAFQAQQDAKKRQAGNSLGAAKGSNVAAMSEEEQLAYALGMSMAESEPAVLQVIRGNVHMK